MERELEQLKSKQGCDQIVQELLRHNKALEEELTRLKGNMGVTMTSSPGTASSIIPRQLSLPDELLLTSTVYDAIPSPGKSPGDGDHSSLPDFSQHYVPLSNNCQTWASTVPCPVPSNVLIPPSSADDCTAGYIPTSVPTSILTSSNTRSSNTSAMCHKDVARMVSDGVDHYGTALPGLLPDVRPGEEINHTQYGDAWFRPSNSPLPPSTPNSHPCISNHHHQQCAWNIYPMYYLQVQSSVH